MQWSYKLFLKWSHNHSPIVMVTGYWGAGITLKALNYHQCSLRVGSQMWCQMWACSFCFSHSALPFPSSSYYLYSSFSKTNSKYRFVSHNKLPFIIVITIAAYPWQIWELADRCSYKQMVQQKPMMLLHLSTVIHHSLQFMDSGLALKQVWLKLLFLLQK